MKTIWFDGNDENNKELLQSEYHFIIKNFAQLKLINERGTKEIRKKIAELSKQIKMFQRKNLQKREYDIKKGKDSKGEYLRINYTVNHKSKNIKVRIGEKTEKEARDEIIQRIES